MFDNLTNLGYGVITFAIVIGVGAIILKKFGDAVATCATDYTYNVSAEVCQNSTGGDQTNPANAGWSTLDYMQTQMGTTGLAGWTPAIIALSVGMLFLGVFFVKGGRRV